MPKIHCSFMIGAPPGEAQDMFGRDIVTDLHNDGDFSVLTDENGHIELVQGPLAATRTDFEAVADPDVLGHPEEEEEPDVRAATTPPPETVPAFRLAGVSRAEGILRTYNHHLAITFIPEGPSTRVTIDGHAPHAIRDALQRLGTPGHWPETAARPHD